MTEDSKSGKEFWGVVAEYLSSCGLKCTVVSAAGNLNIFTKCGELKRGEVANVWQIPTAADGVFVAMDCVASMLIIPEAVQKYSADTKVSLSGYEKEYFSRDIADTFADVGCRTYVPNYYCYEEILLSFRKIEQLIHSSDSTLTALVRQVEGYIWSKTEYWIPGCNILTDVPADMITHTTISSDTGSDKTVFYNREQFAAELLRRYTLTGRCSQVKVNKSTLGGCWKEDCAQLRNRRGRGVYADKCHGCCWETSPNTAITKMEDLSKNTIFSQQDSVTLQELCRELLERERHT